jgi:hypothetical protein
VPEPVPDIVNTQPIPVVRASPAPGRPHPHPLVALRHRNRAGHLLAIALVVVMAGSLAYGLYQHAQASSRSAAARTDAVSQEASVRDSAATWIASQVSRTLTVSCDPLMCLSLQAHGIPSGSLRQLRPGRKVPPRSDLVVATAPVRRQLGGLLALTYAPEVIATFGSGSQRIDIRSTAERGDATFRTQLSADITQRRESGAELLTSNRIAVSAASRRQLSAGQVDPRLLVTIAGFAASAPVRVVAFGTPAPGVSPDVSPLRSAELTAAGTSRSASDKLARSLLSFLQGQPAPFSVASAQLVHLAGGLTAVRFAYSAPSPIGLLTGATG